MAERIDCPNCGARIVRPAGFARNKIRCGECGYYAETPREWRDSGGEPVETAVPAPRAKVKVAAAAPAPAKVSVRQRADLRDTRPDFEPDAPAGVPLLVGTQDEDDGLPYGLPGTGTKPCPHCREQLPLSASLCIFCGADLVTGAKPNRAHQPMSGWWDEGLPAPRRVAIFAGLQVVNLALAFLSFRGEDGFSAMNVITMGLVNGMHVALQAFLLGTQGTFKLRRNAKKQVQMTRSLKIAFVPAFSQKVEWKETTHVGILAGHDAGMFAYGTCLYLLLMGVVPGILFYYFVIHPTRFNIVLGDVHGSVDETLYRTTDQDEADEVARFVAEATGLHFRAVM